MFQFDIFLLTVPAQFDGKRTSREVYRDLKKPEISAEKSTHLSLFFGEFSNFPSISAHFAGISSIPVTTIMRKSGFNGIYSKLDYPPLFRIVEMLHIFIKKWIIQFQGRSFWIDLFILLKDISGITKYVYTFFRRQLSLNGFNADLHNFFGTYEMFSLRVRITRILSSFLSTISIETWRG